MPAVLPSRRTAAGGEFFGYLPVNSLIPKVLRLLFVYDGRMVLLEDSLFSTGCEPETRC